MTLAFKYLRVEGFGLAPFIPLRVHSNSGRTFIMWALIDSGAEGMLLPKVLAEFLGLQEVGRSESKGIGGSADVSKTQVMMTIKNDEESCDLQLTARVLQNDDSSLPVLLGRAGFFDHFHITFKQNQETIILEKVA